MLPVKWHQLAELYGLMASLLRKNGWQRWNRRPSVACMGNGTTHSMSSWCPWNLTIGRQYSIGRSPAWRRWSHSNQEAGAGTEVNFGIDAPDADIEEGVQSMLTGLRNPGDPESVEIVSTDLHNERCRGQSCWHDLAGQSSACRSWLHSAQESTVARPFGACQRVEDHSISSADLQHNGCMHSSFGMAQRWQGGDSHRTVHGNGVQVANFQIWATRAS